MAWIRSAFSFGTSAVLEGLAEGAQPLDRAMAGRPGLCAPRRVPRSRSALRRGQVRVVAEAAAGVLQRELAHLALDPGRSIATGGWFDPRAATTWRHGGVVERDAGDLGEDRRLPGLVAEAGLAAPGLARLGVELAVAAVGECRRCGAAAADALEEAAEQVDAVAVRVPRPGLGASDVLDPRPQLVRTRAGSPARRRSPRLVPGRGAGGSSRCRAGS
jgi:hypothetical protein